MLKNLRIQNIILIEQAEIPFSAGLNVLTGETGAGKSAIMHGLSLAIGERADSGLIRKGCDKGIVEAAFDIDKQPALKTWLEEAGIDHEEGQELIIRREILPSGKGRILVNHQVAQLSLLRRLGDYLVEIVGQRANQSLFSLDYHRTVLDLYGELASAVEAYQTSFSKENELRQTLERLVKQDAQRLREIDICHRELEELEEASVKEGEDEELFAEYTLLIHSKELAEKAHEINQALNGERQSVLAVLNRQKAAFDSILELDRSFSETAQAFHQALLELEEVSHTMRHYQSRIHHDPGRLLVINERLTLIARLKRKYGNTVSEIDAYQEKTKATLQRLENADAQIEELGLQLSVAQKTTQELAAALTSQRTATADKLQEELTAQLHILNMSKAKFIIKLTACNRSSTGDDKIEFFLQPNIGEHEIALKDGASGGEISRVLLALQTLLAGKEQTPTLIFDEVDANIGGETATIIGDKLKTIGWRHQVICITHFPQVASQARHHLRISKEEREGRTLTFVRHLDLDHLKKEELERMSGGKRLSLEGDQTTQSTIKLLSVG